MPGTMELSDSSAGTLTIGGDLEVRRLGYGAMRITGKGVWGPPEDPDEARAVLRRVAEAHGASTGQVALAWLLRRSPVVVPIPGTSSVAHLEENVAATDIELSDAELEALDRD
jgi:aryl-alcohol dehydrogenase-like predicted oxidoreductase